MKSNAPFCADRIGLARLTKMAFDGINLRPLWHELMERVTDDQEGAGIGMDLSLLAQLFGDQETGLAMQKEVLGYQRLFRSPCAAPTPGLRVLALAAEMDIGGNTPIEFLLEGSDVEVTTLYVVPGAPLPESLPEHDIAIVIAPDDDKTQETLDVIQEMTRVWPRRVLNPSAQIRVLDRDRLYRLLKTVPGLEIPMTSRLTREELATVDESNLGHWLSDAAFPLIVRPIGSHAGRGLAKLDAATQIADYLGDRPEGEFFISRFVDYASPDGQFRKYRLVCRRWRSLSLPHGDRGRMEDLVSERQYDRNSESKRAEEAHFMVRIRPGICLTACPGVVRNDAAHWVGLLPSRLRGNKGRQTCWFLKPTTRRSSTTWTRRPYFPTSRRRCTRSSTRS